MQKGFTAIFIIVAVTIGIVAGSLVWQYNLYQRLSQKDLSCGGDWSYNVKCPVGSYCQSLNQGELVGGLCKPYLSSLFKVTKTSKSLSQQSAKSQSTSIPSSTTNETANWKTFQNEKFNYSIKYPTDWDIIKLAGSDDSVMFSSRTNPSEGKPAAIIIYVGNSTELSSGWQTSYQPYYEISSKEKGDKTFIFRASSYPDEGGAAPEQVKQLAKDVYTKMIATFKFLDQENTEGKFCGGIAANLPENQCPEGYRCQLDGNYPDAAGKCVKEWEFLIRETIKN